MDFLIGTTMLVSVGLNFLLAWMWHTACNSLKKTQDDLRVSETKWMEIQEKLDKMRRKYVHDYDEQKTAEFVATTEEPVCHPYLILWNSDARLGLWKPIPVNGFKVLIRRENWVFEESAAAISAGKELVGKYARYRKNPDYQEQPKNIKSDEVV